MGTHCGDYCNYTARLMRTSSSYVLQDWPDHMQMTEEAFADYVNRQERDEFEVDIRNISCTLHQLVLAREETIVKLRQSADYLDSVWFNCKVTKGQALFLCAPFFVQKEKCSPFLKLIPTL